MALDFRAAMEAKEVGLSYQYDDTKTMLYALAIGMGRDPLDRQELEFVYEKGLKTVPTLATVIAWGARDLRALGVEYSKVVAGGQGLTIHRPLPASAKLTVDVSTKAIYDKGKGKGAVIVSVTNISLADSGEPLCTLETSAFARADGGFKETSGDSGEAPKPQAVPSRDPDWIEEIPTRADQPLLYRLLGDRNVLHADPDAAKRSGFPRPILHGLCTYGICCHAVLKTVCNYQSDRIKQFDIRFSAPVFAGETLVIEIWQDRELVFFRAKSKERNVVVANNGFCRVGLSC